MRQRGRKSAAALSVVTAVAELRRLPEPPGTLTQPQATVWRSVMSTVAADLIGEEAFPVLVEYCRAVVTADQIAEQLAAFDPAWLADEDGLRRWNTLSQMQTRVQGMIGSLGGKLRLNPSSRIRAENAGTMAKRAGAKRKPWQTDDE